jgi:hypothetical protein
MPTMTVPRDPRPQFTMAQVAVGHLFGGPSFDQVQQILPGVDQYIQPNAWPRSRPQATFTSPTNRDFSPLVAASQVAPDVAAPKSAGAALWPNLK